jgi:MFS family permease
MYLAAPCLFLVLAFYLQEGHGLTALESAAMFTPLAVTFVAGSFAAPRILARFGDRALAAAALSAATGAAIIGAVVLSDPDGLPVVPLALALGLFGLPQGMVMPNSVGVAMKTVPSELAGSAAGVLTTTQQVGNVLGVAMAGVIFFALLGDDASSADYAHAFAAATGWTVAFAAIAAGLALRLAGARSPLQV